MTFHRRWLLPHYVLGHLLAIAINAAINAERYIYGCGFFKNIFLFKNILK
jgi:hypothetical protein